MKKHNLFILLLALASFWAQAQSNMVTLYGFKQQSTGGMQKRGDIDETGKLIKQEPGNNFQYAIYLTTASENKVYPVQLWIHGKGFSVKAKQVTATELLQKDTARQYKDLEKVVEKARSIWRLMPIPLAADKSSGQAKALTLNNDIVVLYKTGGKLQYGVLNKFVALDPAILQ